MNKIKLSELDLIALANVLAVDLRKLKNIYVSIGIDAINIIACNNLFFMINDIWTARTNDLFRIAMEYDRQHGKKIVNELFRRRIYTHYGCYYYSPMQLYVMNHEQECVSDDIRKYEKMSTEGKLYFPSKDTNNRNHFCSLFRSICKRLNRKLPEHIMRTERNLPEKKYNINVDYCFRILNFYLSLDRSFIGFKKIIDMQLKVTRKNPSSLIRLIKYSRIWTCDSKRCIIYDSELRVKKGLSKDPSKNELASAHLRFNHKALNILTQL